jgi:hypothetical protein
MDDARVILVMLRRPRLDDPNEMRTDPLWEFGSFGCTGCHRANLMNPAKLTELHGAHLGFAQNGPHGIKLVHLTPPIRTLHHGSFGEAKWSPAEMPLTYASAPTLVNSLGASDVPLLMDMLSGVRRGSPVARFASKFRSRCKPLPPSVAEQVIAVYERQRSDGGTGSVARFYVDALPCVPPRVDHNRQATYQQLLQNSAMGGGFPAPEDSADAAPRGSDRRDRGHGANPSRACRSRRE